MYTLKEPHKHRLNENQNIKDFPCDHCDKSFMTKFGLKRHIKVVHGKIHQYPCDNCDHQYSCDNCDKSFAYGIQLSRHGQKCRQESDKRIDFEFESESGEKNRQLKCGECQLIFANNFCLIKHKCHKFWCDNCDKTFVYKNQLSRHVKKCRRQEPDFESESSSDDELFHQKPNVTLTEKPRDVFMTLPLESSWKNGLVQKYKCDICDIQFSGVKWYKSHLKKLHHSSLKMSLNEESTRNEEIVLLKSHKEKTKCPHCYRVVVNLPEHLGTGKYRKFTTFKCDICNIELGKLCFKRHFQMFHNSCDIELLSTAEKEKRNNCHKKSQKKQKTKCPHCLKFVLDLPEHLGTGLKKITTFKCEICNIELGKHCFNRHFQMFHKKKCPHCDQFVDHLQQHLGKEKIKKFKCTICGIEIGKKICLKRHLKVFHNLN